MRLSQFKIGFPGGPSGKEPACQCRRHKRREFNPGLGRSPRGRHGNALQYSCLEIPMNRGSQRIRLNWARTHKKFRILHSCPKHLSPEWTGYTQASLREGRCLSSDCLVSFSGASTEMEGSRWVFSLTVSPPDIRWRFQGLPGLQLHNQCHWGCSGHPKY